MCVSLVMTSMFPSQVISFHLAIIPSSFRLLSYSFPGQVLFLPCYLDTLGQLGCMHFNNVFHLCSKTPAPSNLKRARLGTQGEPRGSSTLHPSIEASAKPRMSTSETALAALTSTRLLLLTISEHPRLLSCIPIILCPSMSGGRRNPGSLQRIGCLL